MSSQKCNIVKYLPRNLSGDVCSEEFVLHLSEVSISDLSRLLISRPDICVCSNNLVSCLQENASKLKAEQKFGPTSWKYSVLQEMVSDDELRKVLLKKDYTFTHLIPLLCRITVQILLYKTISSYPTWLKTDGGHNIFYVKIVDATATLIVYLNRNKVWVICLYGAVPQKHKVGDQVFGPVIHDFV